MARKGGVQSTVPSHHVGPAPGRPRWISMDLEEKMDGAVASSGHANPADARACTMVERRRVPLGGRRDPRSDRSHGTARHAQGRRDGALRSAQYCTRPARPSTWLRVHTRSFTPPSAPGGACALGGGRGPMGGSGRGRVVGDASGGVARARVAQDHSLTRSRCMARGNMINPWINPSLPPFHTTVKTQRTQGSYPPGVRDERRASQETRPSRATSTCPSPATGRRRLQQQYNVTSSSKQNNGRLGLLETEQR